MKAATTGVFPMSLCATISIHAAREGGDSGHSSVTQYAKFISIHAAREGGDFTNINTEPTDRISIHAAREGGDDRRQRYCSVRVISIHAAREGGDDAAQFDDVTAD